MIRGFEGRSYNPFIQIWWPVLQQGLKSILLCLVSLNILVSGRCSFLNNELILSRFSPQRWADEIIAIWSMSSEISESRNFYAMLDAKLFSYIFVCRGFPFDRASHSGLRRFRVRPYIFVCRGFPFDRASHSGLRRFRVRPRL